MLNAIGFEKLFFLCLLLFSHLTSNIWRHKWYTHKTAISNKQDRYSNRSVMLALCGLFTKTNNVLNTVLDLCQSSSTSVGYCLIYSTGT